MIYIIMMRVSKFQVEKFQKADIGRTVSLPKLPQRPHY